MFQIKEDVGGPSIQKLEHLLFTTSKMERAFTKCSIYNY